MDAVAGVDNTGIEVNNAVAEIKVRASVRRMARQAARSETSGHTNRRARPARKSEASSDGQSINIWNYSDGGDGSDDEVDWQEIIDEGGAGDAELNR